MRYSGYEILADYMKKGALIVLVFCGFLFSQEAPEEFDFNISIYQSFYFFINSNIDGDPLVEGEDWIASFNEYDETMGGLCEFIGQDIDGSEFTSDCQDVNSDGILSTSVDVCVGSFYWSGEYTTVPVMGNDGTIWTAGYMEETQLPKFKIYDASEGEIYNAVPSVVYPWSTDLAFYVVNISVIRDCNGDLGGYAFIDNCDACVGGNTGLEENYLDVGCGCGTPLVGPFYSDEDGDGLGAGEEQYFCSHPGTGWSTNQNDPYPSCVDNFFDCNETCGGSALIDDCGVCSSGDTGLEPNANLDCNNECFGFAYTDDCDQCVGGSTGVEPCDFQSDQPEEFFYYQSTLQAFYYVVDASFINGENLSTQDWIGVFNGDVCVGSIKWDGNFTTVPSMGDDGSEWTDGYLNMGDYPTFKVYDASVDQIYEASFSEITELNGAEEIQYTGWGINDFYYIFDLTVQSPDCNNDIGGLATFDDCGVCSGGSTGLVPNADLDCAGICFGDAFLDNCGVCASGTSGNDPNVDDLGCGCFMGSPQEFYADSDGDGFGFGEVQLFCQEPGSGWVQNNIDLEPFCFNSSVDETNIDQCGICNGENQDFDCAGVCFGGSELDECGVCDGDNSSCQSPLADDLFVSVDEDQEILIELSAVSPSNSELTFEIVSAPYNGIINASNQSSFNYIPNLNFNGIDIFTYIAFDGQFYSDLATVTITVNSINDAPVAQDIIIFNLEDSTLVFQVSGTDVDGDDLSYMIVQEPENGQAEIDNNIVTYTPNSNYFGSEQIGYIADDGHLQSDVAYISIQLQAVNDPPIAEDMNISFNEDEVYSFSFMAHDVDNNDEDLSVIFLSDIEFGLIELTGLDATIIPNSNIEGNFSITYKVLDGYSFSEAAIINVEIIPVNDPPEILTILDQTINEDEIFIYGLNIIDVDSDSLDFSVNNVENANIFIDNQILTIQPDQDFNGQLDIQVTVSDGEYQDTESFSLQVLPVNDPPIFSDIQDQESMEDEIFSIELTANDVDGDDLVFWYNNTDYISIDIENDILYITPNLNWNGSVNVTINVTDGEYADYTDFVLTINPVNDSPEIVDINNQFIDEDTSLSYILDAFDVDGDELNYHATVDGDAIASINNNILEVTPELNFFGDLYIDVVVSDNELADTSSFTLEVLPINDPPTLEFIDNQEVDENTELVITIDADDVDGDQLSYESFISSGYGLVQLDGNSLILNPSPSWFGEISINLIVSDGEYYVFQIIEVDVLEVDDPPVSFDVTSTMSEDEQYSIQLLASDTDSENLTYSINTSPSHGSVSLDGSTVLYTPVSNYNGPDSFLYDVFDGTTVSNISTVSIDIIPLNDPPTASDVEYSVSDFEQFDLNEIVNDIDGDDLDVIFITQNYGSELTQTLFNGQILDLGDNIFSYIPPDESVYFDFILYKVTDGTSESGIQTISFNLFGREFPRNMAPIAFDQDVNLLEDETVDITLIGFDVLNPFSDNASFELTSLPSNGLLADNATVVSSGTPSLAQWVIEYTPNSNFSGTDSFTYKVTNPENSLSESENGTIYINISPQNDAPSVYNSIFDQTLTEDSPGNQFSLSLFFVDIDDDPLSYTINSTNTEVADIYTFNDTLAIVPFENKNSAPFSVSITATDGELDVTQTFSVEILPVNDPPTAESANYELDEDSEVPIVFYGYDIEYDPLTFIINDSPESGSVSGTDNVIRYIPNENYNGQDSFTFVSNDGQYSSNPALISLTINPVNDAPTLTDIEEQTIDEDTDLVLIIDGEDIDGDDFFYTVTTDVNVESIVITDSLLTISPISDMFGEITATVTISDGELQNSDTFSISVLNVNDAPDLSQIPNQETDEDEELVIILEADDIDGDDIIFEVSSNIENTEITIEDNLLIVNPPANYFGDMIITVSASDGELSVEQNFTISFTPLPDPPQIGEIQDQEILEGEQLYIDVIVYDPDDDVITLSVQVSEDLSVSIDGYSMMFETSENARGDYEVIVTADDGVYSVQESFTLSVININDPPVSYSDNIYVDEDQSIVFPLIASDPDFDDLNYYISTETAFGTLEISDGFATYSPNLNYYGQDSFTFFASDSQLSSNVSTVNIYINPVNDGPIVTSTPVLDAIEDILYTYQVTANDPEDDSLTYVLDSYPEGMEISDLGLITWIPTEGVLTSGDIIIVVFDGGEDGALPFTQNFSIDVEPVNDRPHITSGPDLYAYEDQQYTYQIDVYDPDSEIFYYNLLIGPAGMYLTQEGLISWTPTEGVTSSGTVAFVVWDVEFPDPTIDLPAIQEFIVEVIPVNDPPMITSSPVTNATEDIEYQYQVLVEDVDDDMFIFSLLQYPSGMIINESTGLISWTPTEGVLNSGNITVQALDGVDENSLSAIQNFSIIVTPVNDPPIILSTAPSEGLQGEEYIYNIEVEDPDDSTFTYLLFDAPDGMSVDFNTGTLSWIPIYGGVYGPIILRVQDGGEDFAAPDDEIITINIQYASGPTTVVIPLHAEYNLISYPAIPEDNSIENIFSDLGDQILSVVTEGLASTQLADGWFGSISYIEPSKGYWLRAPEDEELDQDTIYHVVTEAIPTPQNFEYSIHEDYNLVSYIGIDGVSISDALPDNIEQNITSIIGEGEATIQLSDGWYGSLEAFYRNKGYWIRSQSIDTLNFSWNIPDTEMLFANLPRKVDKIAAPEHLEFKQSMKQSFYFIENIILENEDIVVTSNDWIVAYNNNTVIGARKWNGRYTDIPTMGFDGTDMTSEYCREGEVPKFKLYLESTGEFISLDSKHIVPWSDLSTSIVSRLNESIPVPDSFEFSYPYPNPFNPSTLISFSLPFDSQVKISVYDILGQRVDIILDKNLEAGYYDYNWKPGVLSSGIYFINIETDSNNLTHKVMYIK